MQIFLTLVKPFLTTYLYTYYLVYHLRGFMNSFGRSVFNGFSGRQNFEPNVVMRKTLVQVVKPCRQNNCNSSHSQSICLVRAQPLKNHCKLKHSGLCTNFIQCVAVQSTFLIHLIFIYLSYSYISILIFFHPIQILSDKARLIKRTQLKRTPYRVLGKLGDNEQTTEPKKVQTEKSIAG